MCGSLNCRWLGVAGGLLVEEQRKWIRWSYTPSLLSIIIHIHLFCTSRIAHVSTYTQRLINNYILPHPPMASTHII